MSNTRTRASVCLLRDTRLVPNRPPPLFDHVALRVRDIAKSRAFYERALQPFGVRVVESSQGPGFATDDRGETSGSRNRKQLPVPGTSRSLRQTAKRSMRSTPQPSRQEGSTTEGLVCGLAITPRTTPHSSSTPMGTT